MSENDVPFKNADEDIFKEFCINRELKKSSVNLYRYALQKYCSFTNKTLQELIEEAEDEEDSGIRFRKRKISRYLKDFKLALNELALAEKSVKHILLLVKAFYREFEIEIPKSNNRKSKVSMNNETIDDLPTMEEIERFMEYSNSVYKAIIVTGLSSGMSRAELSSLTFKHFFDALDLEQYPKTLPEIIESINKKDDFILFWNIKRIKTGKKYFTFSSPESLDRIKAYLKELYYKFPDYEPDLDDTLFRSLSRNSPINPGTMGCFFRYINNHHDFRRVNNRYVVRNHNLRKYFATTLEKNKVPHLTTRWLLGHSIDNVTDAYFKADPETVKNDYLAVVNQLTTNKVEIKVIDKYGEIKHDLNEIKEDLDEVKSNNGLVLGSGKIDEGILEYIHFLESKNMGKNSIESK